MTVNVKFIDNMGYIAEKYYPTPAKVSLPAWYKKLESYHDLGNSSEYFKNSVRKKASGSTIKKCMPVFDALSAGYMLYTPQDLQVHWDSKEGGRSYEWSDYEFIGFHNNSQAGNHPMKDERGMPYPKFANPWTVITPKGYSCLFVQPFHRESVFEILPGVVDTDTFHGAVQLPFQFKDPKWEGVIPAGTPMCQVIPFKREQFTHSVHSATELGYSPDELAGKAVRMKFINGYKDMFWSKKDYN